jgi:hypothetical protein
MRLVPLPLRVPLGRLSVLVDERTREFDEWVSRRLAGWTPSEIHAFERWLLDECLFEFIPAVRLSWRQRSVEDRAPWPPEESAA